MKLAVPVVLALACVLGCPESPSKDSEYNPKKLREEEAARIKSECDALARRRIGYFSVRDASPSVLVREFRKVLELNNVNLSVFFSTNYEDRNETVTLTGGGYTVASLSDDLCAQIGGTWSISYVGKGMFFLKFKHPDDTAETSYTDYQSVRYHGPGQFELPGAGDNVTGE